MGTRDRDNTYDVLHISCAYESKAVFLTVDEVLIKKMKRFHQNDAIYIENHVKWLMEMDDDPSPDKK